MDASRFLTAARRHAHEHPDELPCQPEDFGAALAYLSALQGRIELDESRLDADIAAANVVRREALAGGYRDYLRGMTTPQPSPAPQPRPAPAPAPAPAPDME
jgi:hypothetical protein